MEQIKIEIKNGNTILLSAYENFVEDVNATYVEELSGWDDFSNASIETAPALSRAGSYIISTHVGEREVVIKLNAQSNTDIKEILHIFQSQILAFASLEIHRVYQDENLTETRREVLVGLLSSIGEWTRVGQNASISLTLKCNNPLKTVYLNGSTTPEAGGQL